MNPNNQYQRKAHRQICSLCHEVCRVDFHVPYEIWIRSVHHSQVNERLCLSCFTRLADERQIKWCEKITFHPESMIAMIERNSRPITPTDDDLLFANEQNN